MNEDRYFERLLDEHLERQERYTELIDEERELLIEDLKIGNRVDEFELTDYLYEHENSLIMALANENDNEVVRIVRMAYEKQLHEIVIHIVDNM